MFTIIAKRTSASMFGEATARCKNLDGSFCEFETREQAAEEANRWNTRLRTDLVFYSVEELS